MPTPDRMLATIRRAIELVRDTPGRSGAMLRPVDCTEMLVAGDLHGHIPNFQVILQKADLANHPTRHLVLQELIHGKNKYPNGSDKSHQMVDLFAALKCQFPKQVHYLPGNHEMAQWTDRPVGKADEQTLNQMFRNGPNAAYGSMGPSIYLAYLELFRALPLAIRTENAVFVSHSLTPGRNIGTFDPSRLETANFTEADYQPGGLVYGMLWGRDTAERTIDDYLRKVDSDLLVSGHIPTETGFLVPNHKQVIVDCAASPAAYVLFPTNRPLTHAELVRCIVTF